MVIGFFFEKNLKCKVIEVNENAKIYADKVITRLLQFSIFYSKKKDKNKNKSKWKVISVKLSVQYSWLKFN